MEPDDVPDITPDLSPEDDAAMRKLLGSLESGSPEMPAAVQARLDAVIAEQAAARSGTAPGRNVRRLAVAWLGAAAAVVVAVAGVGVVADQLGYGGDSMSTDSTSAQDSAGASSEPDAGPSDEPTSRSDSSTTQDKATVPAPEQGPAPVIRPGHVAEDAQALLVTELSAARVAPDAPVEGCIVTRPQRRGVQVFGISYRGEHAVLILEDGPPRTASVWSCDDELLESAELPD